MNTTHQIITNYIDSAIAKAVDSAAEKAADKAVAKERGFWKQDLKEYTTKEHESWKKDLKGSVEEIKQQNKESLKEIKRHNRALLGSFKESLKGMKEIGAAKPNEERVREIIQGEIKPLQIKVNLIKENVRQLNKK